MAGGGASGVSSKATQYSWSGSPVSHMIVASNVSGQAEATIYPSKNANPKALSQLTDELTRRGMSIYFDEIDGVQVLKTQNFPNPTMLVNTLVASGTVVGAGDKQDIELGESKSAWTKVREKGTNIAGVLGIIGHAGLATSGAMAGDMNRVKAGLQYGTSAGILAMYGAGNQKVTAALCDGLYDHLRVEGIEFDEVHHATPAAAYRTREGLEKGYDSFKKNSLLVANLIGVGGNVDMMKSGYSAMQRDGVASGIGRFGHGSVNLVGAGVASFVPETSPEKIAQKEVLAETDVHAPEEGDGIVAGISGALAAARDGIARAPLAFQGGIMLADNILDMSDAFQIKQSYERRDSRELVELPPEPDKSLDPKSKEFKTQEKTYKAALQKAGHYQRLDINLEKINEQLAKAAKDEISGEFAGDITVATTEKAIIDKSTKVIDRMGGMKGVSKELDALMEERKVFLQELVEKERFGKNGWVVAAAKVGAWTTSSAFQMIAKKNTAQSTDSKYGEIFANVATMALEVPKEQRAEMMSKAAGYLAAQDVVYIGAEELEAGIAKKLAAIEHSPWLNGLRSAKPIQYAKGKPENVVAEAALADRVVAPEQANARYS